MIVVTVHHFYIRRQKIINGTVAVFELSTYMVTRNDCKHILLVFYLCLIGIQALAGFPTQFAENIVSFIS